jgi:large subunit ribosomal protein L15
MKLCDLSPPRGARKKDFRKGRGPGSGSGKTAGRGNKGQKSRHGYSSRRGFEGGQMPLIRRVPKRGFRNFARREYAPVNLERLGIFEAGSEVTPELLVSSGIVKKLLDGVKILGRGEIGRPLRVRAHRFSKDAARKIEAAGGTCEVITRTRQAT